MNNDQAGFAAAASVNYYRKLDGLRFVAISFVLIEHFAYAIGSKFSAGYYGVDLFFVISGFLITSILLKSKGASFGTAYKRFIGRRTLRIFPLYYLVVVLLYIFNLPEARKYIGYLLTYTYNYVEVFFHVELNPLSHFWSLCVEEQFYLFWPFLVLGLRNNRSLLKVIIIMMIAFAFSQMTFKWWTEMTPYNFVNLLTRMGSLGLGGLGAVLKINNKLPQSLLVNKWVEVFAIVLLAVTLTTSFMFKYVVLGILSLFFVVKAVEDQFQLRSIGNFLSNRYVVYFGSISYGIYVFHLPVGYYLNIYFFSPIWKSIEASALGPLEIIQWQSWIFKLPLFSGITILVAMFSFRFFEKPILSLKDRFFALNQ